MPRDSSQSVTRSNTTDLATSFTTQSDLEMGTELIFFVRAYTQVGPGDATSVVVSTLEKPRETMCFQFSSLITAFPHTQLQ